MLFVAVGKLFSYEKKRDQLQQKDLVMADEKKLEE
jgi:hypothetical protein